MVQRLSSDAALDYSPSRKRCRGVARTAPQCVVCLCDVPASQLPFGCRQEGHFYCHACFIHMTANAIKTGDPSALNCCIPNCSSRHCGLPDAEWLHNRLLHCGWNCSLAGNLPPWPPWLPFSPTPCQATTLRNSRVPISSGWPAPPHTCASLVDPWAVVSGAGGQDSAHSVPKAVPATRPLPKVPPPPPPWGGVGLWPVGGWVSLVLGNLA